MMSLMHTVRPSSDDDDDGGGEDFWFGGAPVTVTRSVNADADDDDDAADIATRGRRGVVLLRKRVLIEEDETLCFSIRLSAGGIDLAIGL